MGSCMWRPAKTPARSFASSRRQRQHLPVSSAQSSFSSGDRLGPYDILEPLGTGGRARSTSNRNGCVHVISYVHAKDADIGHAGRR
jgi:hypothetical protein